MTVVKKMVGVMALHGEERVKHVSSQNTSNWYIDYFNLKSLNEL
jgi:Uri superfamily endonuclease